MDSAIIKSRTLLEEVFIFGIECKGGVASTKGKIFDLYTKVKNMYNMHENTDIDQSVKTLLNGLTKIIYSIGEMRNIDSDAHGVGAKRITIKDYHARLFVNSSMILAEFLLSVFEAQQ